MKYTKKTAGHYELIYSSDWIDEIESLVHWSYYWHQAKLVEQYFDKTSKILEIGIGTGFLSNYLRSKGRIINTLDIDPDKKPDICAEASGFNYTSLKLDVVLAFEVFEHIPIPLLTQLLNQLYVGQVPNLLFSVPWNDTKFLDFNCKLPRLPQFKLTPQIPKFKISTPAHFWELSLFNKEQGEKKLITEKKLKEILTLSGYECTRLTRVDNIQFYRGVYKS